MTYDDFSKQDLVLLVCDLIDGLMQDDEEQAMIYLRETCKLNDEQLDFLELVVQAINVYWKG